MLIKKKYGFNSALLSNLIFGFFPISFIIGNAIVNINVILFCLLGFFPFKIKNLTNIKLNDMISVLETCLKEK